MYCKSIKWFLNSKLIANKKNIFLLAIVILLGQFTTIGQALVNDSLGFQYSLLKDIEVEGQFLATDQLQNVYVVTQTSELVKFSPKGKEVYRYSNFNLGDISYIDVSNPFNILLFYETYQTIEILDRTLTLTGELDLLERGFSYVKTVAMSANQQIWIYDELNFKLKKINAQAEVIFESADLSVLFQENFSPNFMIEKGGEVYLNQENHFLFVFDVFGNYLKRKTIDTRYSKIQIIKGTYVYRKNNTFYIENPKLGDIHISEIQLPEADDVIIDAEIQKERIFVLLKDRLRIYTLTEMNKE